MGGAEAEERGIFGIDVRGKRALALPAADGLFQNPDYVALKVQLAEPDLVANRRAPIEPHARIVGMGVN